MKKKVLSLVLSVSMIATILAGCGNKTETPTPTPETTPIEETSVATPETDAGTSEFAKADGPIVYWSMWDSGSNQANAIQEAIDAYSEASGNEVKVEWKGRDIQTLIAASLDAGEAIDIYEDDFQRLSQQFADYALPLDDMAAKAGYDTKSNAALTGAVKGWAGSLVAAPYQPYASGVFYNKAIFDEAGVTEPKTWTEFLDVCAKIKEAGYNPIALDDAYIALNLGYHLARYMGQDAVKDLVVNGNWAEDEKALAAAKDMEDLVTKGYFSEFAPGAYPEGENEIGYDETAMVVNASWVPDEITGNTGCDLEWGMFSYPSVDGGVDGTEGMMIGAQGMSISKDSKNAQAAFDLIMFLITGEQDAAISAATNSIPADPANDAWPEIIKNCKPAFDAATKGYEWNCGVNENADFKPTIDEWGAKLFAGDINAQEFIDGLEKASTK